MSGQSKISSRRKYLLVPLTVMRSHRCTHLHPNSRNSKNQKYIFGSNDYYLSKVWFLLSEQPLDGTKRIMLEKTDTPTTTTSLSSTSTVVNDSNPHVESALPSSAEAQSAFDKLGQILSRQSALHLTETRGKEPNRTIDVEKQKDYEFDLKDYLRNDQGAREAHGIKRKALGVLWEGLTVSGVGGFKVPWSVPLTKCDVD
jgi:hypothetical protein